eukprot:6546376-Lingulodinium_polyedra.AAC.1
MVTVLAVLLGKTPPPSWRRAVLAKTSLARAARLILGGPEMVETNDCKVMSRTPLTTPLRVWQGWLC